MLHLEFCSAVEAKDFQVATGIIKEHPELDINELYGPLLLSQSNKTSTLLNVSVVHEDKEMVKFLLRQPNIDVNRTGDIEWSFIDVNVVRSIETPLYSAVKNGCVEIVQLLLNHPGIDIYKGCTEYYYEYGFPKTDSFTPLDEAFTMRREDLIEMFISHTKMDVNRRDKEGMAPLEMALVYKCRKIAILLINNLNTEITKPRYEVGHNILHLACDERSPDTLKLILARQEHIDTKIKIIHERHWINGKNTALKIARTDEIRKLLEDYEIDPHRVRFALRSELGFNVRDAAELLWLQLFIATGFLGFKNSIKRRNRNRRFFRILDKLPLELQMLLCNLSCWVKNPFISESEMKLENGLCVLARMEK